MRRLVVAITVIVLVGSATMASAARLVLHPSSLSAASAAVGRCDTDGIKVSYRLAWKGHAAIDRVDVDGIADKCVGLRLAAVLLVQGKAVDLGAATVAATHADDNSVSLAVAADVWATAVESVEVTIS